MIKYVKRLKLGSVLFSALLILFSCINNDDSIFTSNGSITYTVNGTDVIADEIGEVSIEYYQYSKRLVIFGITDVLENISNGTGGYDHSVAIVVSEVENLSDMVGASIPLDITGATGMTWELKYLIYPTSSQPSISEAFNGTLNITSVSDNKLVASFSGDLEVNNNSSINYIITNGLINSAKIKIK